MKRSRFSLVSLLLLLTMQVWAYKQESIDIKVNSKTRNMIVFTPKTLPAKSPLMIVTHGMNQDPEYQYGADKMYELIDTEKFVIAYLRGINKTWDVSGTTDRDFVSKTIDEMATRYDIDRDRVYWSGFSMGSALIYHCMADMQNKIAAFAPTSGIAFGGKEWQKCTKPVNVIHCHAYGDDVFKYDDWNIRDYVKSLALELDECKAYQKTANYKTPGGNTGDQEIWSEGKNGTMVELFSYNANWHNPSSGNSKEIWNFCKRFALNQPLARITQPEGETTYLTFMPEGTATFPDVAIEATAKAQKGEVEKVEIYEGSNLLATTSEASASGTYDATLTAPQAGQHTLRAVVTDSNGKTGEGECVVNCEAPKFNTVYSLSSHFNMEGAVPQDWYVSNGTGASTRVGGGLPYTNGPRLLHFTNETRGMEYGLLVQNSAGKEKAAFAKFGVSKARSNMMLSAGRYTVRYRLYNWNRPDFSPITVVIEDTNGQEVASTVCKPTKNIGGNTSNEFPGVRQPTLDFNITQPGYYVIAFYADAEKDADFVLGVPTIKVTEYGEAGITTLNGERETVNDKNWYTLDGRRISAQPSRPGIYITGGKTVVVK
jgi:poly(3-hydroxybutyrate) depolymerase